MNKTQNIFLACSMGLYFALCMVLHPYYGYMLDADAVGYLSVAERFANGDWQQGINGLWSPFNSLLLVPFIQNGIDAFMAAKAINMFCGGILLIQIFYLCKRFIASNFYLKSILLALPIVLVYYVYFQIFADVLQLVFVLSYLQIVLSKNYFTSNLKIIVGAIFMALAFYAKAYSLPFYFLHSIAIFAFVYFKKNISFFLNKLISTKNITIENTLVPNFKKPFLGFLCLLVFIMPWAIQLHNKYGGYSFSGNSGKLNMSWNLIAHKEFKEDIKLFIPPTYNNSVSFWEDPMPSQAALHSPFESTNMFARWIFRIGHTALTAVSCINEISVFALAILLAAFGYFFWHKQHFGAQILCITALVLPLGYLSMHIETRYIWLLTFLLIILTGILLDAITNKKIHRIACIVFALSLLVYPLLHLEKLRDSGKENFELAQALNEKNIHGSFVGNNVDAGKQWVAAYLSKNRNYTIEKTNYTQSLWNSEVKKYGIQYYWQYIDNECNDLLLNNSEIKFQLVLQKNNCKIYKLNY